MARPPALPPDTKAALVIEVIAGRLSLSDAAGRAGVSAQSIANWRRQFIEAGTRGLAAPASPGTAAQQAAELHAEIQALKMALAEAHLALKIQRNHRLRAR